MANIQFSGLASGIDSASLIDQLIDARATPNKFRQSRIDFFTSANSALEELNTKFLKLNDLVDKFRTINGSGFSKSVSSSSAAVATGTATAAAVNGSTTITVSSLAKAATGSFNQSYASDATAVSTTAGGTVSFLVGTGADQVTVSASVTQNVTSVQDLANALNSDTDAAGRFQASVVNIGTSAVPAYRLMFQTLQSGAAKGSIASVTVTPAITELQTNTMVNGTDAQFTISGITGTISRPTNSVSDVIPGLTANLVSVGTSTLNVSADVQSTASALSDIVEAYNDIVKYVADNDKVKRQESAGKVENIYGSLARTTIDNDFISKFQAQIMSAFGAGGTTVTRMAELGFSTNRDGTLEFKEDTFISAAGEDPAGAQAVLQSFADGTSGITGFIFEFTKFDGLIDLGVKSNASVITQLTQAIDNLNRSNDKYRELLRMRYSRLETTISRLQSQGSSLSSLQQQ